MHTLRTLCEKINIDLDKVQSLLGRIPVWSGDPDVELNPELADLVILFGDDPEEAEREVQKLAGAGETKK
ncbi:MAG TPA: hypothetical protein PLX03_01110, partial [Candidatus Hydrogenedentes bacterium]|nr:hypothetical protein [Candidatus Hydrogenedentota bacterium]